MAAMMTKIVSFSVTGSHRLMLQFSDGSQGEWNAWPLFSNPVTVLTEPLLQPREFANAFVENGTLAWPNGLELAPWTLHEELRSAGKLERIPA
jgi:Protein of unknown function (DUF2442)